MIIQTIGSDQEYETAMKRLDQLFDVRRSKDEQAEFDLLAQLIDAYEDMKWPLDKDE